MGEPELPDTYTPLGAPPIVECLEYDDAASGANPHRFGWWEPDGLYWNMEMGEGPGSWV